MPQQIETLGSPLKLLHAARRVAAAAALADDQARAGRGVVDGRITPVMRYLRECLHGLPPHLVATEGRDPRRGGARVDRAGGTAGSAVQAEHSVLFFVRPARHLFG